MKRRNFIQQSILATGALALPNLSWKMSGINETSLGVQLYSVRDKMASDPVGTILKVGEMGYRQIETANYTEGKFYGMLPSIFKNLMKTAGVQSSGGHFEVNVNSYHPASASMSDNFKHAVEASAAINQQQFICPWIAEPERKDEDAVKLLCEVFNQAGEYCKNQGLQFGYHNHAFEFEPLGEKMLMDHLVELTDPGLVSFQLDVYWVRFADQDPMEWLQKLDGRVMSLHVKDMAGTLDKETIEVGEGVIDFKPILQKAESTGVKYYIVELEHYRRSPMEGIRTSLENLKTMIG